MAEVAGGGTFVGTANPSSQVQPGCWDFVFVNPEKSTARKGTAVHSAIRGQLRTYYERAGYGPALSVQLPDASFDHYRDKSGVGGGGPRTGAGNVDLAYKGIEGNVMLLAEIKPANKGGISGAEQLLNYINKANANDEIKRFYGVRVFAPMLPNKFGFPSIIYAVVQGQSKQFEIRWCEPGLLLYKEIPTKDKNKSKDKQAQTQTSPSAQRQTEQRGTSEGSKGVRVRGLELLTSKPKPLVFKDWTPPQLRNDILGNKLPDGLYRDRYSAAWAYGARGNVVVWVKTGAVAKEYEYYQEYPSDPAFYTTFAKRRGLSARQTELVMNTMLDYNRDMWSLIAPNPSTGEPSSRSPYYARDELRAIYGQILKGVFTASAIIVGAGAGITSTGNAMRPSADVKAVGKPFREIEEPVPAWVLDAVRAGGNLLEELETLMRVAA